MDPNKKTNIVCPKNDKVRHGEGACCYANDIELDWYNEFLKKMKLPQKEQDSEESLGFLPIIDLRRTWE